MPRQVQYLPSTRLLTSLILVVCGLCLLAATVNMSERFAAGLLSVKCPSGLSVAEVARRLGLTSVHSTDVDYHMSNNYTHSNKVGWRRVHFCATITPPA